MYLAAGVFRDFVPKVIDVVGRDRAGLEQYSHGNSSCGISEQNIGLRQPVALFLRNEHLLMFIVRNI